MKAKITLIGCGWLGIPLSKELLNIYELVGTTTSVKKLFLLESSGVFPLLYNGQLISHELRKHIARSESVVLMIPPKRKVQSQEEFLLAVKNVIDCCSDDCHLIYISSTSVYSTKEGVVSESDKVDFENVLVKAEKLVTNNRENVTVFRFAGLIGGERHPANFFKNSKKIPQAKAVVNMLHLKDAIEVIKISLGKRKYGTFNVCASKHPSRDVFYNTLLAFKM